MRRKSYIYTSDRCPVAEQLFDKQSSGIEEITRPRVLTICSVCDWIILILTHLQSHS